MNAGNIHLRSITVNRPRPWPDTFPFNVPIIVSLTSIEFSSPVTFLVGENGSGKSTFLEAIACAVGSIAVGSESVETDRTLAAVRSLANDFRLTWSKKTRRGFFMRSEDFFGYARRMAKVREELQEHLREVEREYEGRSETARHYARMPYVQELGEMKNPPGYGLGWWMKLPPLLVRSRSLLLFRTTKVSPIFSEFAHRILSNRNPQRP